MRKFLMLATVAAGSAWAGNVLALDFERGGFWQRACHMAPEQSCGGCAVSCPIDRVAVCTRGMNVWRGHAWSCSFEPSCSCQRTVWDTGLNRWRRHRHHWGA
jgi:hypothetical protein